MKDTQIEILTNYLLSEYPQWIQGVGTCAIRIIENQCETIQALRREVRELKHELERGKWKDNERTATT